MAHRGTGLDLTGWISRVDEASVGPKHVDVELANRCNESCIYCWNHSPLLGASAPGAAWQAQELPAELLLGLIDELLGLETERIHFTGGGEPFLHPSIFDALEQTCRRGMRAVVSTNFTRVDDDAIARLVDIGVDEIVVNLSAATAETYSRVHPGRTPAAFRELASRLSRLNRVRPGSMRVVISNVVFATNEHELEAMYDFAADVGASGVRFTVLDSVAGATDTLLIPGERTGEVYAATDRLRARKETLELPGPELDGFATFVRRVTFNDPRYGRYDLHVIDTMPCFSGWLFSRILASGDVCPCRRGARRPLGNLRERSFAEIWRSPAYEQFRRKKADPKDDRGTDPYFSTIGCYKLCGNLDDNQAIRRHHSELRRQAHVAGQRPNDVLLLVAPPWDVSKPPLHLPSLAASLRRANHRVGIWDLNIDCFAAALPGARCLWQMEAANTFTLERHSEALLAALREELDRAASTIAAEGPRVVGMSVNMRNRGFSLELARRIKQRDPRPVIVLGGPEVPLMLEHRADLAGCVDALVLGEGEELLPEMLRQLDGGSRRSVPGLVWNDGRPHDPAHNRFVLVRALDELPFPTYEDFDLERYHAPAPTLPFLLTRGCPYRCSYCIDSVLYPRYRTRAPERAVEEIRFHIATHQVTRFSFNDLLCNGNVGQLERFCDLVLRDHLPIAWDSYAAIHHKMDDAILGKMRAAGCSQLNYGFESGSPTVLQRMNKRYSVELAEDLIRRTHRAGIVTAINIIVGFPRETEAEFQQTCEFLARNRDHIGQVTNVGTCMLSPGSAIDRRPEDFGVTVRPGGDWSDDLGMTIEVRMARLRRLRELLADLKLRNVIVNRPPGLMD